MIANNAERKPKELWSDLGEGEPVRAIEVEDEHAEARFVAAEIAALVEMDYSGTEIAVFYRTNAQSRVLEDVLVRQGIAYQVIGGPRFYERAEIKDAIAYLQVLDNPFDLVSLLRIANRPRRGIGDASLGRLPAWASSQGVSLWEAMGQAEQIGDLGGAAARDPGLRDADAVADVGRAGARTSPSCSSRCSSAAARSRRSRPSARSRRAAASRTCRSSSASPGSSTARRPSRRSRVPAGDLALLRPGRDARRDGASSR